MKKPNVLIALMALVYFTLDDDTLTDKEVNVLVEEKLMEMIKSLVGNKNIRKIKFSTGDAILLVQKVCSWVSSELDKQTSA